MHFLSKSRHRINVCSSFLLCAYLWFLPEDDGAITKWVMIFLSLIMALTRISIFPHCIFLIFFQEYASAGYEIKSMEPGYLLYSSLCTLLFGSHYNLYLLFTNCILIILLYKSLRNNNIKYAYFFLLFFLPLVYIYSTILFC